jgi:hypothetical protein
MIVCCRGGEGDVQCEVGDISMSREKWREREEGSWRHSDHPIVKASLGACALTGVCNCLMIGMRLMLS